MDIGDMYFSCVHCGHTVYGQVPAVSVAPAQSQWKPRQPADRAAVRRRQIAKERARAARRAGAVQAA